MLRGSARLARRPCPSTWHGQKRALAIFDFELDALRAGSAAVGVAAAQAGLAAFVALGLGGGAAAAGAGCITADTTHHTNMHVG